MEINFYLPKTVAHLIFYNKATNIFDTGILFEYLVLKVPELLIVPNSKFKIFVIA